MSERILSAYTSENVKRDEHMAKRTRLGYQSSRASQGLSVGNSDSKAHKKHRRADLGENTALKTSVINLGLQLQDVKYFHSSFI